jgi:glycosyltransferase involved in cell wall biosynthesis
MAADASRMQVAAPPVERRRTEAGAPPRVLRVMTRLNVGGPARQALFLTDELARRGYDTHLAYGRSAACEGSFAPAAGLPATYLSSLARELHPAEDLRAGLGLARLMRALRPDVVHTHLAKAGALGRVAALRAGVPVVVHTFHGHVLQEYFSRVSNAAFVRAERALARHTDALVAVAPWVRDELLAMGIGRPEQWHVVPVGADIAPLLAARPDPAEARARLGLPTTGPIVGCVGRLVPVKDHETFLQAARIVLCHRPDATFVLAGDGELRDRLQARARELLGDRAVFLGWVHDLSALYGAMDVVALTSRLEGTPVALIEAAASGTPVVATNVGGVREIVRDRTSGLLVPPHDPAAVAANLVALLEDPEGARRMGEEGATWVRGRFSDERLARDLDALYSELLRGKRAAVAANARRTSPARAA